MKLARQWLGDCLTNHSKCGGHCITQTNGDGMATPWLPTRLLEVGPKNSPTVRIVLSKDLLTSDAAPSYAALSHCWGGADDILKLKRENMGQLFQPHAVKVQDDLPKTFQDAIAICRELDIPYLWIDSLCIIQDSKQDWAHESSLMGNVYREAICTIAATGSATSHDGIFFLRGHEPKLELHIPVNPLVPKEGKDAYYRASKSLALVPMNWERTWHLNLDRASPLNQRGWTFQERLLSRRLLHFGHLGIAWECDTHCASEFCQGGYPADDDLYVEDRPSKPTCNVVTGAATEDSSSRMSDVAQAWDAWITFVEAYLQRTLTFASDRLVAISAVAKAMQPQLGKDASYHAGLWESTLLAELCWVVDWSMVSEADDEAPPRPPPPTEGPPSWSWASTAHPIFFPFRGGGLLQERFTRLLLRLIRVATTPMFQDPFGQVNAGTVGLHGRLIPVRVVRAGPLESNRPKEMPWKVVVSYDDDEDGGGDIFQNHPLKIWASLDHDYFSLDPDRAAYALPVMHRLDECENALTMLLGRPSKGLVSGLLLEREDPDSAASASRYKRIGAFLIKDVSTNDALFGFDQEEADEDEGTGSSSGREERNNENEDESGMVTRGKGWYHDLEIE